MNQTEILRLARQIKDEAQVREREQLPEAPQDGGSYVRKNKEWVMEYANEQNSASGKSTVYYLAEEPTGGTYVNGDIWFDTDDGNKIYIYTDGEWVGVLFGLDALSPIVVDTINGKNTIYYQSAQPTEETVVAGDTWFDTDDGYKMYVYNGTAWAASQFGANAIATGAIGTTQLATSVNNAINGKNTVYYQAAQPTGGTYTTGDTWFDTDDGYKIYVWNGTAWTASQLGANAIANGAIGTTQLSVTLNNTINGKNTVYYQTSQPTGGTYTAGDVWFDTDDGYKMYVRSGSSWVASEFGTNAISAGAITAAKIAANTITATQIAAGTITGANLVSGTITGTQIAAATIVAANIAASTITASQIAAGTITASQIAAATITATQIAAGTITATQIAAGTITGAKIAAGTITASNMQTGTITAASGIIGSLDASVITAGTMSANRIKGDTLTLGGANDINGTMLIKDSANANRLGIDKDGINFFDSTGSKLVTLATTTQDRLITVGSGKNFSTIQAAIDSLPMLINHQITIEVYAGTYSRVNISNRLGQGVIQIAVAANSNVSIVGIDIKNNICSVELLGYNATYPIKSTLTTDYAITVLNSLSVKIDYASITSSAVQIGIYTQRSNVLVSNTVISSRSTGLFADINSQVVAENITGTSNTNGLWANGSTINEVGGNTIAATFSRRVENGGQIIPSTGFGINLITEWTPVLSGSTTAGNPTYTTRYGRYIKIGPLVLAWFAIVITNKGGMAGNLKLGGFPVTTNMGTGQVRQDVSSTGITVSNMTGLKLLIPTSDTAMFFRTQLVSSGAMSDANLALAAVADSSSFQGMVIYNS